MESHDRLDLSEFMLRPQENSEMSQQACTNDAAQNNENCSNPQEL